MRRRHGIAWLGGMLLAALALAARGDAPETVAVTMVITEEPFRGQENSPTPPSPHPTDTITICLSAEPDSPILMSGDSLTKQVLSAVDPKGWMNDGAYGYETQMLVEFPSFENGDVTIEGEGDKAVMTVTYRFRDDITWSDGEPFTINDILFAEEVYHAVGPNIRRNWPTLEEVDKHTLRVTYEAYLGLIKLYYYLAPFSTSYDLLPPLPQHTLGESRPDKIVSDYFHLPNPTLGPYEFVEWRQGDHITLRAVENWWGGEVRIPNLIYRFIPDPNQLLASVLGEQCDYATSDGVLPEDAPFIQHSAEHGDINY